MPLSNAPVDCASAVVAAVACDVALLSVDDVHMTMMTMMTVALDCPRCLLLAGGLQCWS
jgi:hypothetical protein